MPKSSRLTRTPMASSWARTAAARGGSVSSAVSVISMIKRSGRDVEIGEDVDDLGGETGPTEGAGRDVHRHGHVGEVADVGEGPAHDPGREPVDEVGLLAHGDEAIGVEEAEGGVLPAHEGLDGVHVAVVGGRSWAGSA